MKTFLSLSVKKFLKKVYPVPMRMMVPNSSAPFNLKIRLGETSSKQTSEWCRRRRPRSPSGGRICSQSNSWLRGRREKTPWGTPKLSWDRELDRCSACWNRDIVAGRKETRLTSFDRVYEAKGLRKRRTWATSRVRDVVLEYPQPTGSFQHFLPQDRS